MIDGLQALVELIQVAQEVARGDGAGHDRLRRAVRAVQEEQDASEQAAADEAVLHAVLALCDRDDAPSTKVAQIYTLVRDALFQGEVDVEPRRGVC